jgi:hypothetical protein
MHLKLNHNALVINLLIAIAISLVVNFSYLLLLVVEKGDPRRPPFDHEWVRHTVREPFAVEGVARLSPDGHGYLICDAAQEAQKSATTQGLSQRTKGVDSVYIPRNLAHFLHLHDGDLLQANAILSEQAKEHPTLGVVRTRNGEAFDYGALLDRPEEGTLLGMQLVHFVMLAFVMLTLTEYIGKEWSLRNLIRQSLLCVGITILFYFLAPVAVGRHRELGMLAMGDYLLEFNVVLKCSFTLVVVLLYRQIALLLKQKQQMALENELLKSENIANRYNVLMSQINPHFFFNSLNSLSMLVREGNEQKALTYIDQLSYSFRYTLRNGQNMLTTLSEELRFAEAYGYLFKIRYADKLFFDVEVAPEYLDYRLPVLTLQELMTNAVKHNAVTRKNPLHVSIRVEHEELIVENPRIAKFESEPGTGTGLQNLSSRWSLITGSEICITATDTLFQVRLPLLKPQKS